MQAGLRRADLIAFGEAVPGEDSERLDAARDRLRAAMGTAALRETLGPDRLAPGRR